MLLFKFGTERKRTKKKLHLKSVDGNLTSDPNEMSIIAFNFDMDLFGEGQCDVSCMEDLHKDLSKLDLA